MYDSSVTVDAGAQAVSPKVRMTQASYGAFVIGLGFTADGAAAFAALGDGTVHRGTPGALAAGAGEALDVGARCIRSCLDGDGNGFLIGTDRGALLRVPPTGAVATVASPGDGWIEQIAVHRATGRRAFSHARNVTIVDAAGKIVTVLEDHPSTPTGLAFSPDGRRIAVSRYDGASIWSVEKGALAKDLFWHGSHTAISWSPNGRFVVTAMQDKELHCWRLADGRAMRMRGYPAKIRSMCWTADSRYVSAGGADTVTSWYCGGGDPSGQPPLEFGYVFDGVVTQVAAHPAAPRVAAGYDEGTVLIGEIETTEALIARPPGGGAVSALAWSATGDALLAGTEDGAVALIEDNGIMV